MQTINMINKTLPIGNERTHPCSERLRSFGIELHSVSLLLDVHRVRDLLVVIDSIVRRVRCHSPSRYGMLAKCSVCSPVVHNIDIVAKPLDTRRRAAFIIRPDHRIIIIVDGIRVPSALPR